MTDREYRLRARIDQLSDRLEAEQRAKAELHRALRAARAERDEWQERAQAANFGDTKRLSSAVAAARRSRDMWKQRCHDAEWGQRQLERQLRRQRVIAQHASLPQRILDEYDRKFGGSEAA